MTRIAESGKNNVTHRRADRQSLERKVPSADVVRLWVARDKADARACLSALERLVRSKPYQSRDITGYRFLGVSRARRCGVECLCMSFCLERGKQRRGAGAVGRY
jgi:hypothetical protein